MAEIIVILKICSKRLVILLVVLCKGFPGRVYPIYTNFQRAGVNRLSLNEKAPESAGRKLFVNTLLRKWRIEPNISTFL